MGLPTDNELLSESLPKSQLTPRALMRDVGPTKTSLSPKRGPYFKKTLRKQLTGGTGRKQQP